MTLMSHRQQDIEEIKGEDLSLIPGTINAAQCAKKACGASCILCAEAELKGESGTIKASDALKIYIDIAAEPGSDSVISKVVKKCIEKGLQSELIQNTELMDKLCKVYPEIKKNRAAFETDTEVIKKREMSSFAKPADLFENDARVMLVVAFFNQQDRSFATHWLLARQDDSQTTSVSSDHQKDVVVMNPDGGQNHNVSKFWDWLSKPGTKSDNIGSALGSAEYIFTGVALRLTRMSSQTVK